MARRMVRFVPRVESGGLSRDGHTQQQEDEQCFHEELPAACCFGQSTATKVRHSDIVAA